MQMASVLDTKCQFFSQRGFVDNVSIESSTNISGSTTVGPYGVVNSSVNASTTDKKKIRVTLDDGTRKSFLIPANCNVEVDDDVSIVFGSKAGEANGHAFAFVNHTEGRHWAFDVFMLGNATSWLLVRRWARLTAWWLGALAIDVAAYNFVAAKPGYNGNFTPFAILAGMAILIGGWIAVQKLWFDFGSDTIVRLGDIAAGFHETRRDRDREFDARRHVLNAA